LFFGYFVFFCVLRLGFSGLVDRKDEMTYL